MRPAVIDRRYSIVDVVELGHRLAVESVNVARF